MAVGFQNVVKTEILTKIDMVMVLLKSFVGKFSPHFDHLFEECPHLLLERFGYLASLL
jgi:hypothetical protein